MRVIACGLWPILALCHFSLVSTSGSLLCLSMGWSTLRLTLFCSRSVYNIFAPVGKNTWLVRTYSRAQWSCLLVFCDCVGHRVSRHWNNTFQMHNLLLQSRQSRALLISLEHVHIFRPVNLSSGWHWRRRGHSGQRAGHQTTLPPLTDSRPAARGWWDWGRWGWGWWTGWWWYYLWLEPAWVQYLWSLCNINDMNVLFHCFPLSLKYALR